MEGGLPRKHSALHREETMALTFSQALSSDPENTGQRRRSEGLGNDLNNLPILINICSHPRYQASNPKQIGDF